MGKNRGIEPSISSEAVRKATGRTWPEWFALLDDAGAARMTHREIVAVVADDPGVSAWYGQMIAVSYEQARGLREKHEKADGFQVSASKTLRASVDRVFSLWIQQERRERWLPHSLHIRRHTACKSLRVTWLADGSSVDVYFYDKGEDKSQVTVNHSKLPDAETAQRLKVFWKEAMHALNEQLQQEKYRGDNP